MVEERNLYACYTEERFSGKIQIHIKYKNTDNNNDLRLCRLLLNPIDAGNASLGGWTMELAQNTIIHVLPILVDGS